MASTEKLTLDSLRADVIEAVRTEFGGDAERIIDLKLDSPVKVSDFLRISLDGLIGNIRIIEYLLAIDMKDEIRLPIVRKEMLDFLQRHTDDVEQVAQKLLGGPYDDVDGGGNE